jgi:hypothetical protein
MEKALIIKSSGKKEVFNPIKLENSLLQAGASKQAVQRILEHLSSEIKDGTSTEQIFKHAHFLLEKIEKPVALRYSLRRAVMELGPSGFPFEKFIAEIMKEKGFVVETDKVVQGHCAEHEIDVIAYNENKLIFIEAKFHNELGLKSDLKVALYIKARFDDLKDQIFNFGGQDRKLDESWLVTNTKFSSSAIGYGKCQKLKLIGWNYPAQGNLQDMIQNSGLHPLTSLTSLSNSEKHLLLDRGIVLCKSLKENGDLLKEIGLSQAKIGEVINEVSFL